MIMSKNIQILILILYFVLSDQKGFTQWTTVSIGSLDVVTDIQIANPSIAYYTLGFPDSELMKTSDGGNLWASTGKTFTYFKEIQTVNNDTVFGLGGGALEYSYDGSVNFQNANFNNSFMELYSMHFPSNNIGYVAGMNNNWDSILVFKTTNGGQSFNLIKQVEGSSPTDIYFLNASVGFMATDTYVYKTIDGGLNWTVVFFQMGTSFQDIHFPDPLNGFITGITGDFLKTTDGGDNWTYSANALLQEDPWITASDVHFLNQDTGYVSSSYVGNGVPGIQFTTDGGLSWAISHIGNNGFECVEFLNDTLGWAGGASGQLIRFDNNSIPNFIQELTENFFFVSENYSHFILNFKTDFNKEIALYDISGKQVLNVSTNQNQFFIEKNYFISGIYILNVISNEKVQSSKIVFR